MTKFILLYNGPATDMAGMTEGQQKAVMEKWGAWIKEIGDALIDVGQPMANGIAVVDNGSSGTATPLNGYSIVQAESMEDAKALVKNHPFLSDGAGKFSVEIHELMPTPKM